MRPRRNWPHPADTAERASPLAARTPPPLTREEEEMHASPGTSSDLVPPLRREGSPPVLRRTLAAVLGVGFAALVFYLSLELIQTIDMLLGWPAWMGLPLVGLILALLAYGTYRLVRVVVSIRTLPLVPKLAKGEYEALSGREREALRRRFFRQITYLRKRRQDPADPVRRSLDRLEREAETHPAAQWLQDYEREILRPLGKEARERVRQIAITAGASAALSPWRILDAIIAFNAAVQAANDVLRIHGIRPAPATAVAFAFDTFLNTFLATVVEDVSSDLADSLAAQVTAETGATAAKVLAPKIAEGLTAAVFVRRLGNRMIRRLHPFAGV